MPSEPQPLTSEPMTWNGRTLTLAWLPAPYWPPQALVTQVSGVCTTDEGQIVLVRGSRGQLALPGGHPEPGEEPLDTFRRELWEEACATLVQWAYLGAQKISDSGAPQEVSEYYQLRYWARVELHPFVARFETQGRELTAPHNVLAALGWRATKVARCIFAAAQAVSIPLCPGAS